MYVAGWLNGEGRFGGSLRIAQGLLKRYEDMWREKFDRMAQLIEETKENDS